jgi:signal transduction histidine kinase
LNVDARAGLRRAASHIHRDHLLAVALSLATAVAFTASDSRGDGWAAAGASLVALAAWMARSRPRTAVVLIIAPALLVLPTLWESPFSVAVAVLCYLAGRRVPLEWPLLRPFAALAAVGSILVLLRQPDVVAWLSLLTWLVAVTAFPWLIGRTRRQHRELAHAGWQRAEQLEREQRLVEQQARLHERARIAGDMHDSLGHELSVLALRAAGLEVAADLPPQHRKKVAELRADAARATQRLGVIVGVLRDDVSRPAEVPVDETLRHLVDRMAASGLEVTLDAECEPGQLDSATYRAAHRVVQEALTNAAKHAPGVPVEVRVSNGSDGVLVAVTNGPPATPPTVARGGYGLVSLQERVRLVGGTLTAGATTDGGFAVTATLPRDPQTAPAPEGSGDTRPAASVALMHRIRRQARRSLALTVAVPIAAALAAAAIGVGYWAFETSTTFLDARSFARLRVGQDVGDPAEVLPPREVGWGPRAVQPPIPDEADCRYYRSGRHPFTAEPLYRMCLDNGTLVSKDVLPTPDAGDEQ